MNEIQLMLFYFKATSFAILLFFTIIIVYLRFSRLDLEAQSRCYYDYIAAYEGNMTRLIGKFCGNQTGQPPPMLTSTTNVMTIQFKTDSSVSGTG